MIRPRSSPRRGPGPLDAAIVGVGCRFPGATDTAAFFENVLAGRPAISDAPPDRWEADPFHDPQAGPADVGRVPSRRGGYLDPVPFDAASFGVMPNSVDGGEPEAFLVLDAARSALLDAGIAESDLDGRRVDVIVGRGNYFNRGNVSRLQHGRIIEQTVGLLRALHPEWTDADADDMRADLRSSLPAFDASTVPNQLTNATVGLLANRLDLRGSAFVVDAASASSLVALDQAARSLRSGRADLALVGGVYVQSDVDFPMVFARLGALSPTGEPRPFAADADGLVPGEGVGVVALKRLADAERDGDRVYAVVRGVGVASDGRGLGLAAPSARGHARAMRRALRQADADPRSVGLIEGHGLGVPDSDEAELRAIDAVYGPSGRRVLGAVSGLIGHAMPAAGMAGLIKAALCLHHRVLPPSGAADAPHPRLTGRGRAARPSARARPWVHGDEESPRRAGVDAFGFAGINAHAIVEEYVGDPGSEGPGALRAWDSEAILLGADDRPSLARLATALMDWLDRGVDVSLKDLAYTLNVGQPDLPERLGIVATSTGDLRAKLSTAVATLEAGGRRPIRDARGIYQAPEPAGRAGSMAFLFPGEGSQYPGMFADLCPHFPEVRARFDVGDRVAIDQGHLRLPSDHVFGDEPDAGEGLWAIGTAINAVLSANLAMDSLLRRLRLRPAAIAGHSSGEFVALGASGALRVDRRFEDGIGALGRVFEGLEAADQVPSAALLAVAADRSMVSRALGDLGLTDVVLAMDNCPHQVVVAGPDRSIAAVEARLREGRVFCERLSFDRAYHTPAFEPATAPVREFLATLEFRAPRVPFYSCATGGELPPDPATIRRMAAEQWARPVAFRDTVEAMYADGVRVFVEVGARGNLTGFVEDILRGRPHLAIASNLPRRSGILQLNHLVATLYAHGIAVDPVHLYARRRPDRVDFARPATPPKIVPTLALGTPRLAISDAMVRRLSVVVSPATASVADRRSVADEAVRLDDDPAMISHRRTMAEFASVQAEVLAAYRASTRADAGAPGEAGGMPEEAGPWVGRVVEFSPGRRVVADRELTIDGDPVAEDHTLGGRNVSAIRPELKGLPVLPFTVMAEILAQAACLLRPGRVVAGLRDVTARRWIRYAESGSTTIRVTAESTGPGDDAPVVARIEDRGPAGLDAEACFEGTVVLDVERADPPTAGPFEVEGGGPCRFAAGDIYRDGWLFHGPTLAGLVGIGASGPAGIEGTIRVLPRGALFREGEAGRLRTDAIVLDNFTHLLGAWGLDQLDGGDVIFPLRLGSLDIFGDDPPEGTDVSCRIAVRRVELKRVDADAEIVRSDGTTWMRVQGWQDWRFHWPSRYRDGFRLPDSVLLGERIEADSTPPGTAIAWLEPPGDMGRPVWRDVLEWIQLGPEERRLHLARGGDEGRRTLRLWGRIAAKEAARRAWADAGLGTAYPADLAVRNDDRGRPSIRALDDRRDRPIPAISIAHVESAAAAFASLLPGASPGIDVVAVRHRGPDFEAVAFSTAEIEILDRLGGDRDAWVARLWAAKEAAGKAIGEGLPGGGASARILAVDGSSGAITVAPGSHPPTRVETGLRGGYAVGWTLIGGEGR